MCSPGFLPISLIVLIHLLLAAFSSSFYRSTMNCASRSSPWASVLFSAHLSGLILRWKISTVRSWAHILTWDPTLQLPQLHWRFPLGCPWSSHALCRRYLPAQSSSHLPTKYPLTLEATLSFQAFSLKILDMQILNEHLHTMLCVHNATVLLGTLEGLSTCSVNQIRSWGRGPRRRPCNSTLSEAHNIQVVTQNLYAEAEWRSGRPSAYTVDLNLYWCNFNRSVTNMWWRHTHELCLSAMSALSSQKARLK